MPSTDSNVRRHLTTAVITIAVCWGLAALVLANLPNAPGPRISGSLSFNEKAKWLRSNLADGTCDVLALGSSIALNSFDGEAVRARYRVKVVNSAYWGMTAVDARNMLTALLPICAPKIVILPTYYGDYSPEQGDFDWLKFARYVGGGRLSGIWTYLRHMDIFYYLLHAGSRSDVLMNERRVYKSLNFDASGSVNFACENFRVSPQRWDEFRTSKAMPPPNPEKIAALMEIARLLQERGIPFIVAGTPLRPVAEKHLVSSEMTAIWQAIETSVVQQGAVFSRARGAVGYDDKDFADFSHLNACGARKWTNDLLERNRDILDRQLRPATK